MRKPCVCSAGLSNYYLRVGELAERMKDNLFKDHYLVRRFIGGIVHQVRGSHAAPTQNNSGLCMEEAMVIVSVPTYHLRGPGPSGKRSDLSCSVCHMSGFQKLRPTYSLPKFWILCVIG